VYNFDQKIIGLTLRYNVLRAPLPDFVNLFFVAFSKVEPILRSFNEGEGYA